MLAILTTHPIQYQVPIWRALAECGRVSFEVWYLTDFGVRPSADREFGKTFAWDIELLDGYPHRFIKTAAGASPVTFWRCHTRERLRDRMRRSGTKALWIQGWQVAAYWQAVRAAKASGVEIWLRGESNDLAPVPFWKRPVKRAVLGRLFAQVDRFLYIGAANRRLYESFGVVDARLYPAPYAVDNERFAQQAVALRPQRNALRRRWRIAQDAFCVLFCGKFIAKKRPLDLIAAAGLLRAEGRVPNIHLLFVGSGQLGAALRHACGVAYDAEAEAVQGAASGDALTGVIAQPLGSFAGFLNQTEISRAYVAADCLVLPSDQGETWGLVANEALASGLACLVSDACGCSEDLVSDQYSYPLGNIRCLADKLERLQRERPSVSFQQLPSIDQTVSTINRAYAELS
jgi:glycosyltransferase involved in cell wall biosynthesis